MNGISTPVKYGTPIFINIANSIAVTNKTGNDIDLRTSNISTNITAILVTLTFLKSWSVVCTKSFIRGPSPATIAFLSYDLTILLTASICSFNSSVAISYVELTSTILYLSFSKLDLISSFNIDSSSPSEDNDEDDRTKLIPSTFSISLTIWLTLAAFISLETNIISWDTIL